MWGCTGVKGRVDGQRVGGAGRGGEAMKRVPMEKFCHLADRYQIWETFPPSHNELYEQCGLLIVKERVPMSVWLCQISTDIFTFLLSFHPGEADRSIQKLETAYVIRIQPAI
jgi:hypothetical protein